MTPLADLFDLLREAAPVMAKGAGYTLAFALASMVGGLVLGFPAAVLRIATPLIFATLGELVSERAGVLNLGIEGIMLLSAMTGFAAAYGSGSLWVGVAAAVSLVLLGIGWLVFKRFERDVLKEI